MSAVLRNKGSAAIGASLLVFALLAAYSNHFHNSFHFDDAHTIETNAAIRELRNIIRRGSIRWADLFFNTSHKGREEEFATDLHG